MLTAGLLVIFFLCRCDAITLHGRHQDDKFIRYYTATAVCINL